MPLALPPTANANHRLLVIAFHYPPENSSTGVLRTLKFTEYLPRYGWCSLVISVPVELYASRDDSDLSNVPSEVIVERTWACDIKSTFGIRGVYPAWLAIPDRYWPWVFSATSAGARAIKDRRIDAIYSTYPIPTAHLVGLRLKMKSGLPWIADFRDPWVVQSMPRVRRWIEQKMERAVVSAADRIICNTPAMRRSFLTAYPDILPTKFVTITNGYDEPELAGIVPAPAGKFQVLHPGGLDCENRNPLGLLRGVRRALDKGWLDRANLQVTFLGAGSYGASPRFQRDIADMGLDSVVTVVNQRIPHRQALAVMAGADVVVVLSESVAGASDFETHDWTRMQVPVKLYEYLRIGRPLLALVSEGAVKELLETVGGAAPISPEDPDRIAAALRDYYAARRPVPTFLGSPGEWLVRYNRENLTAMLAGELDSIISRNGRNSAAEAGDAKC